MSFPFASSGTRIVRSAASRMVLALALASGAVVASAAIAPAAYAQQRAQNSREFAAAYSPIAALTQGEMPNWAAAAAQFETIVAAIKNEDDRNIAGNFALQIGSNTSNPAFQRRGLEMMLQSGKVPAAQVGQFNYFVGTLAYQAEDYAASRTALLAALAAGYTEEDLRGIIVESYLKQGQIGAGLDYLDSVAASGVAIEENWILRSLQDAYNASNPAESLRASTMLVKQFPGAGNWTKGLQVMNELAELDTQAQLDLLRLMRATGAMTQRAEYVRYIENADPRIMSNEVLGVLAEGLTSGAFTSATTDDYYRDVKAIADARAPADRRDLPTTLRDAQRGTALDASVAGDVLYSLSDFAQAESMYKLGLEKGSDRDTALTRIGITQIMQGKYAEAITTLGQVSGARQPVASLWATWAEEKMGG